MLTQRWPEIDQLFQAAAELPPAERDRFLDGACPSDPALRDEVKSLLLRYETGGDRLITTIVSAERLRRALNAPELSRDQMLGKYRVIRGIGSGGMGEVYLAEDTTLGRKAALKVLPRAISDAADFRERIFFEARSASSLNHANIITVFEVGEQDGLRFMATEYIEGVTLRERLSAGPLLLAEALRIAIQIAAALSVAHEAGVVHRDIKPENVMVRPDGAVKVLDFGVASVSVPAARSAAAADDRQTFTSEASRGSTQKGVIIGSLPYMSPEQARGENVDARSDVFSFGALLYELLTGVPAFSGGSNLSVLMAVESSTPQLSPGLKAPARIRSLVAACLEKDPALRPQSMASVSAELEVAAKTLEGNFPLKSLAWLGVAAAIVIALLIAVAIWRRGTSPVGPAAPSLAVIPFSSANSDKGEEYVAQGISDELRSVFTAMPSIRVSGRISSSKLNADSVAPAEIGSKLGVADIVKGTVQATSDRLRVSARLIRSADGAELWSKRFDSPRSEIFTIQREIAQGVARTLGLNLDPEASALNPGTKNLEAYNAFRQAEFFTRFGKNEERNKAAQYFQRAVDLDANYVAAWASLGMAQMSLADHGLMTDGFERSRESIKRALELNPNSALALVAMGGIQLQHDWDWPAAERSMNRALALSPRDASAMRGVAMADAVLGKFDEAAALDREAIQLEPISASLYKNLGQDLYYAGHLEQAEETLKKALELSPGYSFAEYYLCRVYVAQSRGAEALACAKTVEQQDPIAHLTDMALAYQVLHQRSQANSSLNELAARFGKDAPFEVAEVYGAAGDTDNALLWLDRAYAGRDAALSNVKGDPLFKSMEHDPRYIAFLKKMRLPE